MRIYLGAFVMGMFLASCGAIAPKTMDELPESARGTNMTYDGINFGDNLSRWSLDGECDDERFEGVGMNGVLLAEDIGHDAADCMRLYKLGAIKRVE